LNREKIELLTKQGFIDRDSRIFLSCHPANTVGINKLKQTLLHNKNLILKPTPKEKLPDPQPMNIKDIYKKESLVETKGG